VNALAGVKKAWKTAVGVVAALFLLVSVPFLFSSYPFVTYIIFLLFIYITLAASWNFAGGYGGQMNLAQAAFFGAGAYTQALLAKTVPPYFCLLLGGVVAVAISTIVIPCFRLKGTYFAIGTLVLPEIIKVIIINREELGGAGGLHLPVPTQYQIASYYYPSLILALITILITYLLIRSSFGYSLQAMGDDEDAAESIGIATLKYKILSMFVNAFFAGIAGALYASYILYVQPYQAFDMVNWTFYPIFMVLLGGIRTMKGPILGSIIFMGLYYVITLYLTELSLIIFGLLLVVIAVFIPEGISSKITFKMREKKGSGS
jgi:branched-chain amino acid transport system permease protein